MNDSENGTTPTPYFTSSTSWATVGGYIDYSSDIVDRVMGTVYLLLALFGIFSNGGFIFTISELPYLVYK